jgi:hypothetical protein
VAADWLEPPAWWKKYKPLRWVLALVVLLFIYTRFFGGERDSHPVEQATAPVEEKAPVPREPRPEPPPAPPPVVEAPKPEVPTPASTNRTGGPSAVIATAPAKPVEPPPAPKPPPVPPPPPKPVVVPPAPKPEPAPPPVAAKPVTPPAAPKPVEPAVPKPVPPPAKPAAPPPTVALAPKPSDKPPEPPPMDPVERYTYVEKERVPLIDPLTSFDGVQAVQSRLQKGGYKYELSQNEKPKSSRYPPYRTDTIVVTGYKHMNQEGELTLEFFNDRLYEAEFTPKKASDYLAQLRKSGVPLKREEVGKSEFTQGNLRVATNIDFASSDVGKSLRTEPYVIWQDLRLVKQIKDWGPIR